MKEITVEATRENIPVVASLVEETLEEAGAGMKAMVKIAVAMDELLTNVVSYAYGNETGPMTTRISVQDGVAEITISDRGTPFNPLEHEDPDVTLSAEQRKIGGLGIFMVKKSIDELSYVYKDGMNYVTIRHRI